MFRLLFTLFVTITIVLAKHEIYEGFAVYEVSVENKDQVDIIHLLEEELYLDVWSQPIPSRPGKILVSKNNKAVFAEKLSQAGINYVVETDNVKLQLDLEDALMEKASKRPANGAGRFGLGYHTIHRYAAIDQYMVDLAAAYPNVVTVHSGGRSFEGRDIKYLRISTTNFQDHRKPVVFLESLLHAREWATQPATLYAIEKLVFNVTEPDLINDIDWVILPMANPDGFEFSQTNTRFWRKNRANGFVVGDVCMGVDLNRNFDINWGTASSSVVCSETFHGRGPFSEPEAWIVGDIMAQHSNRMAMFVDIHAFGSMILYGFGNGVLPPNGLMIHLGGVNMANAIDAVKWPMNVNYLVGNVAAVLYQASGSAGDFGQISGLPFTISYTFELPAWNNNSGLNGFLVDPDFIWQAGFETWEGLKVGARFALAQYREHTRAIDEAK